MLKIRTIIIINDASIEDRACYDLFTINKSKLINKPFGEKKEREIKEKQITQWIPNIEAILLELS